MHPAKIILALVAITTFFCTRLFGQESVAAELYLCTFENSEEIELEIRNDEGSCTLTTINFKLLMREHSQV